MNNQKMLFFFSALLLLAWSPIAGQAQETSLGSRWTIGVEVGSGMIRSCEICDPSNIINIPLETVDPESYQVVGSDISYRVSRGFGLVGRLSYGQLQAQSTRILINSFWEEGFPIQQNVNANYRMLTLGAKFMLRLNQGDLGLEIRTGLTVHNARVKATGFDGEELDIKYKMKVSRCSAARLSYTYWPSQRFGIQAAAEMFIGDLNPGNSYYEPQTPYEEAYPDLAPELLAQLSPQSDGINTVNFSLGITYRLSNQ